MAPGPAFDRPPRFLATRQLLVYIGWFVLAALAGAGACWCCGHGAPAAWERMQVARSTWRATRRAGRSRSVDLTDQLLSSADVAVEAERGVREIEEFLAAAP